ncbi:Hypothetical predicted protein [Octopus vulgaris]|uniref:Uncharacterized protein n=1 Tax=Octopus vulgaris TaxID=6645 RepID=A0AA36AI98_OCTVU|nr:Hypothetical predicted protein [Octopus vulgaris]
MCGLSSDMIRGGSKEKSDFHRKFYGFESPQKEKRDVFREKKKKGCLQRQLLAEFDVREHSRLLLVVFVVRISLKSRDSQKITKYGCRADDNNTTSSLILSIILIITLTSLNIDAKELGNDCEVKIPPNIGEILSRLVKLEKEVFNFEVHLSNKTLDELLNPVPLDYFANARSFTWITVKSGALTLYKTFPYDFSMHTFNMLDVYVAKQRIDINITCGKQNIQRHDLIYLIFHALKRIIFMDKLQMAESGYMCFYINLSQDMKKNSPGTFEAHKRIGNNRELLKNYCCKLYKNGSYFYHSKSICSGKIIENAMFQNLARIAGAVLQQFRYHRRHQYQSNPCER